MTLKEKKEEMTRRVKAKLDENNIEIVNIISFYKEKCLLRDLTVKDVIKTSFMDAIMNKSSYVVTDIDTLEMLYVQTGPTTFVDIDVFFTPWEDED